jgi:AraC-like DNA-binding protein/tetratricopeptide (TPR) repeat protein
MEHQLSMEEQFLTVVRQIIEENISNESFSVADLAREVGLSRSMLHRKLIRLIGKSATDLITEIRLTKAKELLENDVGTVSEIAYRVGYSNPSYFIKVFKKTFHISPGEVKRKGSWRYAPLSIVKEHETQDSAEVKGPGSPIIVGINILLFIIIAIGTVSMILVLGDKEALFSRLPEWTWILIIVLLGVGFIASIFLFWTYHKNSVKDPGRIEPVQKIKAGAPTHFPYNWKIASYISFVVIVGLILLGGILIYPRIFGPENLKSMTYPVTVLNESGERETHRVFKEDNLTRLALFPFENELHDSSMNWLWLGIPEAVKEDMHQFSNIVIGWDYATFFYKQRDFAKENNFHFFLTGSYRVVDDTIEITTKLYQTSNGAVLNEGTLRGADFFILLDSICSQVRRDLDIAEIILETTDDRPVSTLMTDHMGAYEHYILGRYWWLSQESAYRHLTKAIQLDSTFALAYLFLARFCYIYQASHISADSSINEAIKYRHRLSERSDDRTRILNSMIKEDREYMIILSEILVKIRPRDFNLLVDLQINYLILGLIDRAEDLGVKLNELVPNHPPYQILLARTYLISGKADKAQKVLNELLADDPEHMEAMLMLGRAFLHDNKLEAAEDAFKKAILLMPEYEEQWSYFLTHIRFVKNNGNMEELLDLFTKTERYEGGEFSIKAFTIQNQIFHKVNNQVGVFVYPVSDSVLFSAFKNVGIFDFIKKSTIFSKQGKPIRTYSRQLMTSYTEYLRVMCWWVEDFQILRAKDLLAEGLPQDALTAFKKAYEENPEHYYLANFIQHLELYTSPEYETLKNVFKTYAGSYEDLKLEIQQDHFYFRSPSGLIFEILPLSEDAFMLPGHYRQTIHMVKDKGEVSGLKLLNHYGREEFFPRTHKAAPAQLIN